MFVIKKNSSDDNVWMKNSTMDTHFSNSHAIKRLSDFHLFMRLVNIIYASLNIKILIIFSRIITFPSLFHILKTRPDDNAIVKYNFNTYIYSPYLCLYTYRSIKQRDDT